LPRAGIAEILSSPGQRRRESVAPTESRAFVAAIQRNGTSASPVHGPGGASLLLSDARLALMFANEARYRTLARAFGVPRDQANIATLIGALLALEVAHSASKRLLRPGPAPTAADGVLGGAALRELLCTVAGPGDRDTPLLATLLTIAVVGGGARRIGVQAGHAIRSSSHRADFQFHKRYGYLIDPGHWRQRRADRRNAEASTSR
jgi:hypothetical protein